MLTKAKKEQLVEDFEKWWEHKLERPIIQVTLFDEDYNLKNTDIIEGNY